MSADDHFRAATVEAANRAEATALLIRIGYRVYRPEADCDGEDLVVRSPNGDLLGVQLKGRATVDFPRYGGRKLWMLFPSGPFSTSNKREWFLIPHDDLYNWIESRHNAAPKWDCAWSYSSIPSELRVFLKQWELRLPADGRSAKDTLEA